MGQRPPKEPLMRDYHHPYEPYDIQIQLMQALYACIEQGKVGIFESPTGTGKSLSLICGSLTWLRDHQEAALKGPTSTEDVSEEPTWVAEHAHFAARDEAIEKRAALEARLRRVRTKELRRKQAYEKGEPVAKRAKRESGDHAPSSVDDVQFELAEYLSDDERQQDSTICQPADSGLSSASLQLMDKLGLVPKPQHEEEAPVDETKVFFCSRTHSQLTQFVQELRRVDLPEPQWLDMSVSEDIDESVSKAIVKHVPLGSRKHLCINPKVSRLGSLQAINDRCAELQQKDTPKADRCAFLPTKETATHVDNFRDHALAKVRDIEDLASVGQSIGICPYYASRAALKPSEIVTLPYPLLLQRSAREALDLSLKGHIVIIDEAHNLMDTVTSIHSVTVSQAQLRRCRAQIGIYLNKFRNRLKGKNRVYVAQFIRLLDSISGYLNTVGDTKAAAERSVKAADLLAGKGVDQINLAKLVRYLQDSKIVRKVEGYMTHIEQEETNPRPAVRTEQDTSQTLALTRVQAFIETLTNPAAEGCFYSELDDNGELWLKYMLLDPSFQFKTIVEEARAVILAGGTMSPMDDYIHHLFAYVAPDRLQTFSCGHIIPRENLVALPVSCGTGNIDFDFTFDKRNSSIMIGSLGESLITLSRVVPDGMVVFFPSYAYLEQVVKSWRSNRIWERLLANKPVFQESKGTSSADSILTSYTEAITHQKGGLLLSVIGGKLSEGINFSDRLGRCVVVVGLPFPNAHSVQWKAKLAYIDKTITARTGRSEEGKAAARAFMENACMRAVNQSVGRAIRHKGDYASILLFDKRYSSRHIQGKLPAWIQEGIVTGMDTDIGRVEERLQRFFQLKEGHRA